MPAKRTRTMLGLAGAAAAALLCVAWAKGSRPVAPPADNGIPVAPAQDGTLARLYVIDGQLVKKGELIGKLDTISLVAQLQQTEAEIAQVQQQGEGAIAPMVSAGIAGVMPRDLPVTEAVRVPVRIAVAQSVAGAARPEAQAASTSEVPESFHNALAGQQQARKALDAANSKLEAANAALADAQKARDALRPKIAQAEAEVITAERKASSSKELLDQGAISEKRATDLVTGDGEAKKKLEALKADAKAADDALAAATAAQDKAKAAVAAAQKATDAADQSIRSSASHPATAPQAPEPPTEAKPAAMRITYVQKMVTRHLERVHVEDAPPAPMKVFVDTEVLKSTQRRLAALQTRVQKLKAQIDACKIFAPASGRIQWVAGYNAPVRPLAPLAIVR